MPDYTEAFAWFILECKGAFEDFCDAIDNGKVPAGKSAKIVVQITPEAVDMIRRERLVVASRNGHG